MEAQSMSHIIELAQHPPDHPRSLSGTNRDCLILYIERVPGSKDIILTAVKPRRKIVTVEDIASSLYFLHLRQANDDELLEDRSSSSHNNVAVATIKKDLPLRRRSLNKDILPTLPPREPAEVTSSPSLPIAKDEAHSRSLRRTANDGIQNSFLKKTSIRGQTLLSTTSRRPLRPLGPRPQSGLAPVSNCLPGKENTPLLANVDSRVIMVPSQNPPRQPPRPFNPAPERLEVTDRNITDTAMQPSVKGPVVSASTITLIRRNPSSGEQWNVGEITNFDNDNNNSSSKVNLHTSEPRVALAVFLSDSGYSRFNEVSNVDHEDGTTDNKINDPVSVRQGFFRPISKTADPMNKRSSGTDNLFHDSIGRLDRSINVNSSSERLSRFNRISTTAYRFMSPWNSRCDIESTNNGKSFRCLHTFANICVEASELRCNLPKRPRSTGTGLDTKRYSGTARLRNHFGHSRNNSSPEIATGRPKSSLPADSFAALYPSDGEGDRDEFDDEIADSDEGGLGLSLGREKAGGGKNGGRAKLGKLIIYDEGLKMLDLIVAANMAIWWQKYGT